MPEFFHSPQMNPYATHRLLMVRPAQFGYNEQTSSTNAYQSNAFGEIIDPNEDLAHNNPTKTRYSSSECEHSVARQALAEFDESVSRLRTAGVHVTLWNDNTQPPKPDAIFLNNWFSTHPGGEFLLYPMMAENRRAEIDPHHVAALKDMGLEAGPDLSGLASINQFLEGTGSLVFDHRHRVIFATESPRTHRKPAETVAQHLGYRLHFLVAKDKHGSAPYHTNVVLSVGPSLAVACLHAIEKHDSSFPLREHLIRDCRMLIEISPKQMNFYCANVLEVQNKDGEPLLIVSRTAWSAFTDQQRIQISQLVRPVVLDIPLIERVGGGSARCMVAELFGVDAD